MSDKHEPPPVASGEADAAPGGEVADDISHALDVLHGRGAVNAAAAVQKLAADNARLTEEYARLGRMHHQLAELNVARQKEIAALTARVAAAEGREKRHWNALCRVVEALGKVAPEAAPYADGWALKVREERDSLRADLAAARAEAAEARGTVERVRDAVISCAYCNGVGAMLHLPGDVIEACPACGGLREAIDPEGTAARLGALAAKGGA